MSILERVRQRFCTTNRATVPIEAKPVAKVAAVEATLIRGIQGAITQAIQGAIEVTPTTPAITPHPTPKASILNSTLNYCRTNSNAKLPVFVACGMAIYMTGHNAPVLADPALGNNVDRLELFRIIAHLLNHWAEMKFIADKSLNLLVPRAAPDDPQVSYIRELYTRIKDIP